LIDDVIVAALRRPQFEHVGAAALGLHVAALARLIVPLLLAAVLGAARPQFQSGPAIRRATFFALVWALAATLDYTLQNARWFAYFAPLAPPLLLLAAFAVEEVAILRGVRVAAAAALALAGVTIAGLYPIRIAAHMAPLETSAIAEAARVVEARQPTAQDRLLAIDYGLWINVAAHLAPPTPFFHRLHLLCDFPGAGPSKLDDSLAARPRFVVVGRRDGENSTCEGTPSTIWPGLQARLADYTKLGTVTGIHESFEIYELKPATP
jgi:hypothetical protein